MTPGVPKPPSEPGVRDERPGSLLFFPRANLGGAERSVLWLERFARRRKNKCFVFAAAAASPLDTPRR